MDNFTKEAYLALYSDPTCKDQQEYFRAVLAEAEKEEGKAVEKVIPLCSEGDGEFEITMLISNQFGEDDGEWIECPYDSVGHYRIHKDVTVFCGSCWIVETAEPGMSSLDIITFQ